jgi:ubiquinol-cytochrome c reductase cytochrome b subunit
MPGPLARLRRVLDDRTGIPSDLQAFLSTPVPGGPAPRHALHAATLALVGLLFASGFGLALFYAPTTTAAWGSVFHLQTALPGGALLRAVHHQATGALVVALLLEVASAVTFAAHRRPREVGWWLTLATVGLVLALAMTGALLPWDQRGYWASKVETGIIAGAPLVGPLMLGLLQGGNDLGNFTLTRYFTLHAILLPALLIVVLAGVGRVRRRHGPAPASSAAPIPWWPRQAVLDAAVALLAVGSAFVLAATLGAPLDGPADAASGYPARPAWYFRPLYVLRMAFEGPAEPLATMVLPGLALAFAAALPFLDRDHPRAPRRAFVVGPVLAGLATLPVLTLGSLAADERDPAYVAQRALTEKQRDKAFLLAATGVPAEGPLFMLRNAPDERGRRLFAEHCASCHAVSGEGGDEAPDLGAYLTRPWLAAVIAQPEAPEFFGRTAVSGMEPYESLGPDKLAALADFLHALRDHPDVSPDQLPPALAAGRRLFEAEGCDSCHALAPAEASAGPNFAGYGSDAWLDGLLRDPGHELYFGDENEMPSYDQKISERQRADLIAYLRTLADTPLASAARPPVQTPPQ